MRQRIALRQSALRFAGHALVVLLALALVWYGLMTMLLAFGVSPSTVDAMSGYRSAYDALAGLQPDDVEGIVRLFTGVGGLLAFLVFGYLAFRMLPRPYLERGEIGLDRGTTELGALDVSPRAVERVAEVSAAQHPAVTDSRGRLGDEELTVDVSIRAIRDLPGILMDVRQRVTEALSRHDLPELPVSVTLAGFDRTTQRELR